MGRRAGTKNGHGRVHEARRREAARLMTAVGLWAHLNNLVEDIIGGDATQLSEFQQMLQYAPKGMRLQLLEKIDKLAVT